MVYCDICGKEAIRLKLFTKEIRGVSKDKKSIKSNIFIGIHNLQHKGRTPEFCESCIKGFLEKMKDWRDLNFL